MVHLCVWLPGGGIFHAPLIVPDGVESGLDAATNVGTDAIAEDGGAGSLKIGYRSEASVEKGGVWFYCADVAGDEKVVKICLLYTSPSPRDCS